MGIKQNLTFKENSRFFVEISVYKVYNAFVWVLSYNNMKDRPSKK